MADFGTLALVHARLNIADSVTDVDDKITDYLEESDEYINSQLGIFEASPPSPIPAELTALGSSYAAAIYNYWNSPEKDMKGMDKYEKKIAAYIRANHKKESADGTKGEDNMLKSASSVSGRES